MKYKVGCARCYEYERGKVLQALKEAVARADGFPKLKKQVIVKPNILAPRRPEEAVTTHPEVVKGLITLVRETVSSDMEFVVADSPGYIFTEQRDMLFQVTGMADLSRDGLATVELLSDRGLVEVEKEDAKSLKSLRVARIWLDEKYSIINVAKLKTHVETLITGCIKNIFGIADRKTRKEAHASITQRKFLDAIVDIYALREPDFHVMDAVTVMEGNGPSHGNPRTGGWIFASNNALAIDMVAAYLMGYEDPLSVPLLKAASERKYGPSSLNDIELVGAALEELRIDDYKRVVSFISQMPSFIRGMVHNLVYFYPFLNRDTCLKCGICKKVCPVDAIRMETFPIIDRAKCVKCLCCHEMCPNGSMALRESLLKKIIKR